MKAIQSSVLPLGEFFVACFTLGQISTIMAIRPMAERIFIQSIFRASCSLES